MTLFSLASLFDTEDKYKNASKEIVRNRYAKLMENLPGKPLISPDDPNGAFYYIEIDVLKLAKEKYNEDFAKWVSENYYSLDPVMRLAEEKAIIAMPGGGFDGPEWTLRFSLANSYAEDFEKIRVLGYDILDEYYAAYESR